MKRTIKYMLMLTMVATTLASCTVWEENRYEIRPLPEVETPITPDPWEPTETDGGEIGN